MVLSTPRTEVKSEKQILGVEEAFNIWNMLRYRFFVMDQVKVLKNYVHDIDFLHIVDRHLQRFDRDIQVLKKQSEKYSIKGPIPSVPDVKAMGNSEVLRDEEVSRILHEFLKEDLNTLVTVNRDSVHNDGLRAIFIRLMKQSMRALFDYVDYLKLKGWIEFPPLYPYVLKNVEERIATNEIYQLWDHLISRYRNIHLTQVSATFAYDGDLKVLFKAGIEKLEGQVKRLEETLLYFGIPLPHRYSDVISTPETTELFDDQNMYSVILSGMQDASALHGLALKDCVVNTRVRKLFLELLFDEIDIISSMVKYGKVKGWLDLPPRYRM